MLLEDSPTPRVRCVCSAAAPCVRVCVPCVAACVPMRGCVCGVV